MSYYIYENKEFTPADEDEIFSGVKEYSFLVEINTTVCDLDPMSEDVNIETDYIASNEVDVTNMSEVLDLAQMFHVDENHERLSQTFKVELSEK